MNRRGFLKMLAGLAAFATMPVVRAAAAPTTVAELESAIEGLYAEAEDMQPRAWRDMQEAAKGFEDATLYWRKRPLLASWSDFESGERGISLRFRFGILPADWMERARATSQAERLTSWRQWFVPEGAAMGRVAS